MKNFIFMAILSLFSLSAYAQVYTRVCDDPDLQKKLPNGWQKESGVTVSKASVLTNR